MISSDRYVSAAFGETKLALGAAQPDIRRRRRSSCPIPAAPRKLVVGSSPTMMPRTWTLPPCGRVPSELMIRGRSAGGFHSTRINSDSIPAACSWRTRKLVARLTRKTKSLV